jgi:cell wall-associated NlpC family hydrolase
VPVETGRRIADHAAQLVGVPFRLRGRNPGVGLDCVGVVAEALACTGHAFDVPQEYMLRGEYGGRISAFFAAACFCRIDGALSQCGDILLLRPAPRQAHLAVVTPNGAVHAHAGLGRVVLSPLPLPWPVIGQWRFVGD